MKQQYTIRVNAANQDINIDVTQLPENMHSYLMEYGLKQCLNDAVASCKEYAEKNEVTRDQAAEILLEKRLRALHEGTIGLRSAADPVAKQIRAILEERKGKKWQEADKAGRAEIVAAIKAGSLAPELLEEAKRRVEAARAVDTDEMDL